MVDREEVVAAGEFHLDGPPKEMDVIVSGGFCAITHGKLQGTCHLWRPAHILKKSTQGRLVRFSPNEAYQMNPNVTEAVYKVPGYRYEVVAWFDNKTGKRIG
jgi:hypothetical protein